MNALFPLTVRKRQIDYRNDIMSTRALCILTDGFEEVEAITPIDLLRRAEVDVTLAAQHHRLTLRGRNGIQVQAQVTLDAVDTELYDLLLIPGGPGVKSLREDARVLEICRAHAANGKLIAAICAAPTVLAEAGLLEGKQFTGHASIKEMLPAMIEDAEVVRDGNIITSRGAGTALPFALELIEYCVSAATARKVAESIHA